MAVITVSHRAVMSIKWDNVYEVLRTVPDTEQAQEKCLLSSLSKDLELGESRLEATLVGAQVTSARLLNKGLDLTS